MSNPFISMPPTPVASDKLDTAVKFKMAEPTSPFAGVWISAPQIFTVFAQQTTGTVKIG